MGRAVCQNGRMSFDKKNSSAWLAAIGALFIAVPACLGAAQQTATPDSNVPALAPMKANADPAFEVATIKPSDTSAPHGTFLKTDGRHLIAYNFPVAWLISYAYGVHKSQIAGGPKSVLDAHFDIDGVPDIEGHPNMNQTKIMLRKLLQSRFKLEFHRDQREMSAYAIVVAKSGPELRTTTRKPGDSTVFSISPHVALKVRNASMADFAHGMQEAFLDKPVVDQTGLKGRYDFDLKWTPDEPGAGGGGPPQSPADPNPPPGLYTAIQEQIGLKIESTKAPVEVLVIDHLEMPTAN